MPTIATLALSILIYITFPSYPPIPFRGGLVPSGYPDSLTGVVRAEIRHIEEEIKKAEEISTWADTFMRGVGDEQYWQEKAARDRGRREWADSVLRAKGRELEGLD